MKAENPTSVEHGHKEADLKNAITCNPGQFLLELVNSDGEPRLISAAFLAVDPVGLDC